MVRSLTRGRSFPLGATPSADGVNFSVFSKGSTAVDLLLFDGKDDARPSRAVRLDPHANKTHHYWHTFVPDISPGQIDAYRAHGPSDAGNGCSFDRAKVLLDPYGRCITVPRGRRRDAAAQRGDNGALAFKNVVVDPRSYDWGDDAARSSERRISAQSPGEELPGVADVRRGNTDAADGRRGQAHAARQQQCVLPEQHTLSMTSHPLGEGFAYHLIANAYWEPLDFELPPTPAGSSGWRRLIDTSLEPPADAYSFDDAPAVAGASYPVPAHTVVLFYDDSSAR